MRDRADDTLRNSEFSRIHPDARVYRSVAIVRTGDDPRDVSAALDAAESEIGTLGVLEPNYARYLIDSNQAVVKASLGQKGRAQSYADAAARYDPAVGPILNEYIQAVP